MLHLQKHLGVPFRCQWLFSVARFATDAPNAASPGPAPFAVEDYLVASCGLPRDKARKASKALSHLKSPSKPDAVLAFLSGLGLSHPDIAAAVVRDPKFLCCKVERTLSSRLVALQDHGLSRSQISRLIVLDPVGLRRPAIISKLQFYVPLFGSFDSLLRAVKNTPYERVVKPNVTFLMECGLDARDIAKLSRPVPRLITTSPERVRAMVERAKAVGVPRGTGMFRHALIGVAFLSEEKIAAKVEFLKQTFQWSDAEVGIAISKLPLVLKHSKEQLCRMSDFLITQVGLEPEYIAHRPVLLACSLERRLVPRHYVVNFLKENGLLEHDRSYYTAVQVIENVFMEKFIRPYEEAAPSLAQDYAAACRGEVVSRFGSQEPSTGLASVNYIVSNNVLTLAESW